MSSASLQQRKRTNITFINTLKYSSGTEWPIRMILIHRFKSPIPR